MRRLAAAAVTLAVASTLALSATPASACAGLPCDIVNSICHGCIDLSH